jgi:hypothetical protein
MASYVLVRHKVKDFKVWKPVYDAHLAKRNEAGLREKHVMRGAEDPNEVYVLFESTDPKRAKAFAESADLKATMQKGGVIDRPEVHFLES